MRFLLDLQTLEAPADAPADAALLSTNSASLCLSTTSSIVC